MTLERDLFHDSLEPTDEEWADFRHRVLGRRNDCPSLTAIHLFAMGRCEPGEAEQIEHHCRECGYCRTCADGFRKGAKDREPGSVPQTGSLLAKILSPLPPAVVPATRSQPIDPEEPTTVIEKQGVEDTVVAGGRGASAEAAQEVAACLEPYAAHLLSEVGISRDFTSAFTGFLKEQQELRFPLPSTTLLHLLQTFSRDVVQAELVLRENQTGEAILSRAAVRLLIAEETDEAGREFLQAALDRGQVEQLDVLRELDDRFFSTIGLDELQKWMGKVKSVLTWLHTDVSAPVQSESRL